METVHPDVESLDLRGELRRLFALAGPMMIAQGGLVTMGLVDTWCIGRVSTADMAGVALGNALSFITVGLVIGVSMGIEPLVSQAFGAGERRRARAWRAQGIWAVLVVAVPATIATLALGAAVPFLGWSEGFDAQTQAYIYGRSPQVILAGLYSVYRCYLTSVGRARPALVAVLAANVVNLGLDLVFLFSLGLGALGVGLATSLSSGAMLLVCMRSVAEAAHPDDRRPAWADLRRVLRLGWPIGLQFAAEVGVFSTMSALIALEGEIPLAGHQIAMNLAALSFMAAVGIAVGATARVGHYVGAGRTDLARRVGFAAIGAGAGFMALGGAVFLAVPETLAGWFAPTSAPVRDAAAVFLGIAAMFAISDGVQAVSAGALRGAGDTHSTLWANVVGHGAVTLPVGLGLGLLLDWGAVGYWWGITAGLTATAALLSGRFFLLTRRPIARAEARSPALAETPAGLPAVVEG